MLCPVSVMQKYTWDSEREANARVESFRVATVQRQDLPRTANDVC
jgi:hypothetical protein